MYVSMATTYVTLFNTSQEFQAEEVGGLLLGDGRTIHTLRYAYPRWNKNKIVEVSLT